MKNTPSKYSPKNIKILGMGKYLPPNIISAADLAQRIGSTEEWVIKKSGVHRRHFVTEETNSILGAHAARAALENAGLTLHDIDVIISAGGTLEQLIPSTASLIHQQLGIQDGTIPAFDINSTCLGFITALDVASCLIQQGRFRTALIVCAEISSKGLDYDDHESCVLFGDGAAAAVVGYNDSPDGSKLIAAHMETYSKGAHYCEVAGGGMKLPASQYCEENKKSFLFQMDGPNVFRMASAHLDGFVVRMLQPHGLTLDDITLVIPHQASAMAMRIIQKKLKLTDNKFMTIIKDHGNIIAASMPIGLHEAIQQEKIRRGDLVMFLGTSAGLCIGGAVIEY